MVYFKTSEDATSLTLMQPDDVLCQRVAELQVFFFRYAESFDCRGTSARGHVWRPNLILDSFFTRVSHAASRVGFGVPLNGEG